MEDRPPGGVRFIGFLVKLNAVITGLVGILFVAKASDDGFWADLGISSTGRGFQGLILLLVAGLSWVLVLALYDRSRGARTIVAILTCLRIASDLALLVRLGSGTARAFSVIDLMWSLVVLFMLYGTPGATEWFKKVEPLPPRPI